MIKWNPDAATLYEGDPNIKALGYPDNVMQPASVFDEIKEITRLQTVSNGFIRFLLIEKLELVAIHGLTLNSCDY